MQLAFEAPNPALDSCRLGEQLGPLIRIAKGSPDFVLEFADDTSRVDGEPSTLPIQKHIVVMQVAVEEARCGLRRTQLGVHVLRSLEKRLRNSTVVARCATFERPALLLGGGRAGRRMRGHPPDDVGQNARRPIVIPVYGHADERLTWLETFKQHRPVEAVEHSDDPISVEGL
jgi:hypothetical protein